MNQFIRKNIQQVKSGKKRLNKDELIIILTKIVKKENLEKYADELLTRDLGRLVERSHETSTHFKYLLFKDNNTQISLWLHEYKGEKQRKKGYAEIPHYHRYDFASYIICGGFNHVKFSVHRSNNKKQIKDLEILEERKYRTGDIYGITAIRDIHCLKNIKANTLTLIIRGRSKKSYSESFDLSSKSIHIHKPISMNRLKNLLDQIKKRQKVLQT